MTELLAWSINLGRWAGVQIRVHAFLLLLILTRFIGSVVDKEVSTTATVAWLSVLIICLLLHEVGHLLFAAVENSDSEDIYLWPLGNLVLPSGTPRTHEGFLGASGGLIASGSLALTSALALSLLGARMVFNPFGSGDDAGAPLLLLLNKPANPLSTIWFLGWFGYLNWVLFLANLIPALPLDGGRMVRAFIARNPITLGRDGMLAAWIAHTSAAVLTVIGIARLIYTRSLDNVSILFLALFIELIVRHESRLIEDGGFFEDGIFGYDFSEGYTSLEANAAKVRPQRVSALERWRRKRSEQRRLRRQAQEAAEDRRMDEILEKLHGQGKAALTDDEQRFLVRVSAKLRNRQKDRAEH